MQYSKHLVDGVTVQFTNAPGSGHTLVEAPGHPPLMFDPQTHQFCLWDSPGREIVEPDFSAGFKAALLDTLQDHTRCRREWYRRANAGQLPLTFFHKRADLGHDIEHVLTQRLLQAFVQTHYTVHHTPAFTLRIGQKCPALDALLLQNGHPNGHESAAFITAWNAMGQPQTKAYNRAQQARLVAQLDALGLQTLPGIGQHPTGDWPGEESLLVIGIDMAKACELAREHHQLAFVWHRLHEASQLIDPVKAKVLAIR